MKIIFLLQKQKDVKGRIVRKHVLRNSMIPIVTMIGPAVASIFGGSMIVERMFSIPGLGRYYVQAVTDNDYTMVLGLTVFLQCYM